MKNLCTSSVIQRAWRCSLALFACAALAACGSAAPAESPGEGASADISDDAGGATDAAETDTAGADAGGTDADAASSDVEPDEGADAGPCDGQGCACEGAADCASGYCIPSGDAGGVCAEPCAPECPEGTLCQAFGEEGDAVELCVPDDYAYCAGCEADADCQGGGCVALADGDACAPRCGDEGLCPVGSTCTALPEGGEGCVPDAGQCADCIDPDGDGYGEGPGCLGSDCDETDTGIYEGAPELCDSLDNDCDDLVDEDFNFANDPDNCLRCGNVCEAENGTADCRLGQCVVASCDEGWGDCNGEAADGCEEDLTSDAFCGVCSEDATRPGDSCGRCGSGAYACQDDGSLACEGDLGDDAYNACGGCSLLEGEPFSVCEETGEWRCDGEEAVRCIFPGEVLVTTTDDVVAEDGLCSLRELILAANSGEEVDTCGVPGEADVVRFGAPDATYTLTLAGANEDDAATGDLDVRVPLAFEANGATVIDGGGLDRIFDVHEGGALSLDGIRLQNGVAEGEAGSTGTAGVGAGFGGAIRTLGPLTLTDCALVNNRATGGAGGQDTTPSGGGGGGGGAGLGGAIYASGVDVSLSGEACALDANTAAGGAGARGSANGGSFSGTGGGGGGADGGAAGSGGAGGPGGFGGGGGGGANAGGTAGGAGGFGGGGGGGGANAGGGNTGPGGAGGFGGGVGGTGCCSASAGGGGGAGLGGAIFVSGGTLNLDGCSFGGNAATGGEGGRNHFGGPVSPGAGEGRGGAWFAYNAPVAEVGTTYTDNTAETADADGASLDDM